MIYVKVLGSGCPNCQRLEAETRAALDSILDLSEMDPERDEELFLLGVRQILDGFARV